MILHGLVQIFPWWQQEARKLVGMFHRRFLSIMDANINKHLYIAYIRPHLEYACHVWDPHLIKDIHALESLQKFALRVCNGLPLSNILELLQPPRICCKKTSDETVYNVQANSWPYRLPQSTNFI